MGVLRHISSLFAPVERLVAPTDVDVFREESLASSLLLEERRQTGLARKTVAVCFVMLVSFLVWSAFTPVHEVVSGQGKVLPGGLVTKVQHLEGGIIESVRVKLGDKVDIGDTLFTLDTTTTAAELAKARARLDSVRLSISRLRGQADGERVVPVFEGLSLRRLDSEQPLRRLVASQREASESADGYRDAQLEVIQTDISMKDAELSGLSVEVRKTREELSIVSTQLQDYEKALKSGAISRRERDGIAREKLALEREEVKLTSRVSSVRASIAQARAREVELTAKLRHESLLSITELETERTETEALIRQLEDRVARQNITSSVAGTVHLVNFHKRGDVIAPADIVLEIVPDEGVIFVQAEVPAERIGGVHAGMSAKVKVLTYDFARFGEIQAVVERISPTSTMNEDRLPVFLVDLRLESEYVGPESAQRLLSPGMTVLADVTAGSKSILHYLLRPLRVLSDRALTES